MSWSIRNGELSRDREPTEWEEWCDIHNDSDTCFRLKESKDSDYWKSKKRKPVSYLEKLKEKLDNENKKKKG